MFELFATSFVFCFFFCYYKTVTVVQAHMTVFAHASMRVASIITRNLLTHMIFVLISFWFRPSKMTQNAIPTSVGIA